jgi:tetratricopeptide (TPR) repeat protein
MRTARLALCRLGMNAAGWLLMGACLVPNIALAQEGEGTGEAAPDAVPDGAAPTESMAESTATEGEMADAQARAHFRVGRTLYDAGRFAEAATEFEAAYGLSGRGDLLYNVYLAHRDAQNEAAALVALRNYLSSVPDAPDREHLTARLAALEATVAAEEAEEAEREAERREAERRLAEERARADANEARSRPLWPWGLVGGGAALAAAGITMGAVATSDADTLRAACQEIDGAIACNPGVDLPGRRENIQTLAGVGDALWITGAVVGVAGLVLFFVLPDEVPATSDAPAPSVSASCGPTGCYGSLEVSF